MHSAIESMLEPYKCRTTEDYVNALKEVLQEIALLGLSRGDFFRHAAFYGGTALRIFYGLERYSEDLDFSLIEHDPDFDFSKYLRSVREELGAYGMEMSVEEKVKKNESSIKSAFIKGGTQIHLLKIEAISPPVSGVHSNQKLKIKLEVDTDPPAGGTHEVKYQLNPIPHYVRLYSLQTLFAGKIHAVLTRGWKSRVKGRDFFDYLWYFSRNVGVDMAHLRNRLIQSGHLKAEEDWNIDILLQRLLSRFSVTDFIAAAKDVRPFIMDPSVLNLWSEDFFSSVTMDKLKIAPVQI